MNKGELITALAAKTEMTKKESEAALNAVLDVIAESMAKGEKVQLIGRFREDRCLQGPRFQGRQGSEGRCKQVIPIHKAAVSTSRGFFAPFFKTVAKGMVM